MGKVFIKKEAIEYVEQLPDDTIVEVTKKGIKTIRSKLQVRYYWGVVIPIVSDFHGYEVYETNEMLKAMFQCTTFTTLSTSDFSFMIDSLCDLYRTKLGVVIPKPNESDDFASLCGAMGYTY